MDGPLPLPGGLTVAQLVFLLGLGLMAMILLVRSRRHFRQVSRREASANSSPRITRASAKAPPPSYEQWEVAMHELARDLTAQLDSKIRVLELLIRQADDAAARLSQASAKSSDRDDRPVSRRVEAPPSPPRKAVPLRIADNPRFERVYALADAGMTAPRIANQIGSQVGEVELILSLRSEPQTEAD